MFPIQMKSDPLARFVVVAMTVVFSGASLFAAAPPARPVKVVASFYPMYIMALNVLRDVPGVTLAVLTPPVTGCLHDYSVTTDQMIKLAGADVLVANGAGMEAFLDRIVAQYPRIRIVPLADGIPLIQGQGASGGNPHVWVSPSLAMQEVTRLGNAMSALDPANAGRYQKNAAVYLGKLEALRARMQAAMAPYAGRRIITFHEAFPYFAREFALDIAAVVEREPGSAPSARELAATVELVRKSGVKALFSEPQYADASARIIAAETGAVVYALDPAVTGPDDPDAYLAAMEHNLEVLKRAFSE